MYNELEHFNQVATLTVIPRSSSGASLGLDVAALQSQPIERFLPDPDCVPKLCEAFKSAGLIVEAHTSVGLTVSGRVDLLKDLFGAKVYPRRNKYIRETERYAFVADGPLSSRVCPALIAQVTVPRAGFELNPITEPVRPNPPGYHLRVPEDIVDIAGAATLHRTGLDGRGIRVVMVDTGLYDHPHHRSLQYSIEKLSCLQDLDLTLDERGHGTAMSSLTLAVAPKASFTMVKMAVERFSFPLAGFQRAVQTRPDIITCSWGTIQSEPHLHMEVANALRLGIVVLFAAGNGSTDRKDAMFQSVATPNVITVGGVFIAQDKSRLASDLASSYRSDVFANRNVPDLCGPCGQLPNGNYILFPTQPGGIFDRRNSKYDGTAPDDGWLVSSGTSGATAYAAGVVALALQCKRSMEYPIPLNTMLAACCEPVTQGVSQMGDTCGGISPNWATGLGLLCAKKLSEYWNFPV